MHYAVYSLTQIVKFSILIWTDYPAVACMDFFCQHYKGEERRRGGERERERERHIETDRQIDR